MEEQRVGNFLKQIDFELVQSTLLLKITSVGNEGRQGLTIRKMWITSSDCSTTDLVRWRSSFTG